MAPGSDDKLNIDLLITAGWVIPVEPAGVVLKDHAVAVDGGNIVAVLPVAEAEQRFQPRQRVDRPHGVLFPGLVNAHTHNPMTLMRGVADDLPLMRWLNEHIWPVEGAVMGPGFIRDGIELAIAEMLRGGTTCCNENYFFPDVAAATYQRHGFRALVGIPVIDFANPWAATHDEHFDKGVEVYDQYRGDPMVGFAFAPHAPYTVDDRAFERIRTLSNQRDIPVHCHIHETAQEVDEAVAKDGQRPLARLDRLGLLNERMIAVHMTQLTDAEIALCAVRGVHVVHCPESNLKLASGFCKVEALREAGVNVALGTDGCASNNDLDMISEMRTAAQLGKAVAQNAAAVDAAYALRMATLNSAKAMGLDDRIGSSEVGKQADLALLQLDDLESQPVYSAISHLVYASGRHQISDVWIAGKQRLAEGELLDMDRADLIARARGWGERIAKLPRGGKAG